MPASTKWHLSKRFQDGAGPVPVDEVPGADPPPPPPLGVPDPGFSSAVWIDRLATGFPYAGPPGAEGLRGLGGECRRGPAAERGARLHPLRQVRAVGGRAERAVDGGMQREGCRALYREACVERVGEGLKGWEAPHGTGVPAAAPDARPRSPTLAAFVRGGQLRKLTGVEPRGPRCHFSRTPRSCIWSVPIRITHGGAEWQCGHPRVCVGGGRLARRQLPLSGPTPGR
jgi:hypothetical protein